MKELEPINTSQAKGPVPSRVEGLTEKPQTLYSRGRGTMDEGQVEQKPITPQKPEPSKTGVGKPEGPPTLPLTREQRMEINKAWEKFEKTHPTKDPGEREARMVLKKMGIPPDFGEQLQKLAKEVPEQKAVSRRREEAGGVQTFAQLGPEEEEEEGGEGTVTPGESPIFAGIAEPQVLPEETEEQRKLKNNLLNQVQAFRRSSSAGVLDPERAFNDLNSAVLRGDINAVEAQPYLSELALHARGERLKRMPGELPEVSRIGQIEDPQERRRELKKLVQTIDPDGYNLRGQTMVLIAEDKEASDMFFDKIVSKPFASPEAGYTLSFYAEINLQAFLTQVRKIDKRVFDGYVGKKEASIRFHEMGRIILSESGNPEAFLDYTRRIIPEHMNTATGIRGVELVRQLFEMAFARLYAKTKHLTEDKFREEVRNWVTKEFYRLSGYEWDQARGRWIHNGWDEQQGRWTAQGSEIIRSTEYEFQDPNTGELLLRPLESWEIERAIAFGRNISSSFYRLSELITWSSVPEPWQEWIRSLPSETVVRAMGGLKWLSYKFKIGSGGGGSEFVAHLYGQIAKEDYKTKLKKLGKLDIKEDILPVRFFRGRGFDWGWRTYYAYLGNELAKITIPTPADVKNDPEAVEMINKYNEFLTEYDQQPTIGNYILWMEYIAGMRSLGKEPRKIAEFEIPKELQGHYFNIPEQQRLFEKVILPLMGLRSKDVKKTTSKDYEFDMKDFDYDPNSDQINLSLGVALSVGPTNERVRTVLWRKAADFLPLRLAYFLSEEGVKTLDGYANVRGENGHLFKEEFEEKLIRAQRLRIEEQKKTPTARVNLEDRFLTEAGLTDTEIAFTRALQKLGHENARELAKITFPHIPFMDDVPFENADYTPVGSEAFPRRMGKDFEAFYNINRAFNTIIGNLAQPYEGILEQAKAIVDQISTPENTIVGQDIALQILKTYFRFASQLPWTRWAPFAKTIRNFANLPTSKLQGFFGRNAPSWDATESNSRAFEALSRGIIRRETVYGEEKPQMDKLLDYAGATWKHLSVEQLRLILFVLALSVNEFFKRVREGK